MYSRSFGRSPTAMAVTTFRVAVSITETVLDRPSAV